MYKNCDYCGNSFRVLKSHQRFCSNKGKCKKKWHRRNNRNMSGDTFIERANRMPFLNSALNKPIEPIEKIQSQAQAFIKPVVEKKPIELKATRNPYDLIFNAVVKPEPDIKDSLPNIKDVNEYYKAFNKGIKEQEDIIERYYNDRYIYSNVTLKINRAQKHKENGLIGEISNLVNSEIIKRKEKISKSLFILDSDKPDEIKRMEIKVKSYAIKRLEMLDLDYFKIPDTILINE